MQAWWKTPALRAAPPEGGSDGLAADGKGAALDVVTRGRERGRCGALYRRTREGKGGHGQAAGQAGPGSSRRTEDGKIPATGRVQSAHAAARGK